MDLSSCSSALRDSTDIASFGEIHDQITFSGETTEGPVQSQTLSDGRFWESVSERERSQVQHESSHGNSTEVDILTTPAGEKRHHHSQGNVLPDESSREITDKPFNSQTITLASVDGIMPDEAHSRTQYQASRTEANKFAVKRRKEALISTESKRRMSNNHRAQWFGFDDALLDQYISREKTKCHDLRLACSERSYQSTETQDCIMAMGLDQYRIEVKTLFSAIASTESFEVLGTILQAHRRGQIDDSRKTGYSLSNARRLETIESLDQNIANLGLLRRCHVLQLFKENCHYPGAVSDGFIIETTKGFSDRAKSRRGNPNYLANAEITKAIMNEVYPMLEESCTQYTERYRTVSNLRRLGKRLNLLEMKFGYGILGLLPLGSQLNLSVTDSMYVLVVCFSAYVYLIIGSCRCLMKASRNSLCFLTDAEVKAYVDSVARSSPL